MDSMELLQAIEALIDRKLQPIKEDITGLKEDMVELKENMVELKENMTKIEEDIAEIKENSVITRTATNTLLEWAEQAQIEVKIPLYKKAE